MLPNKHVVTTTAQLGLLLKSARQARKLSQATMAARVGVSQSRISHLEQHASDLSAAQLLAWCAALGLELSLGPKTMADTTPPADW